MSAEGSKKNLASYIIPILSSIIIAALIAGATALISYQGKLGVIQQSLSNQKQQIEKISTGLELVHQTRYTDKHAQKDMQVVDQKFESVHERISNIREILRDMDRKIQKACNCE